VAVEEAILGLLYRRYKSTLILGVAASRVAVLQEVEKQVLDDQAIVESCIGLYPQATINGKHKRKVASKVVFDLMVINHGR
jgi:hypothetical protein